MDRFMEQNRKSRNRLKRTWSSMFDKGVMPKRLIEEGKFCSTSDAGITGYPHGKEKTSDLYFTIYTKINLRWTIDVNL